MPAKKAIKNLGTPGEMSVKTTKPPAETPRKNPARKSGKSAHKPETPETAGPVRSEDINVIIDARLESDVKEEEVHPSKKSVKSKAESAPPKTPSRFSTRIKAIRAAPQAAEDNQEQFEVDEEQEEGKKVVEKEDEKGSSKGSKLKKSAAQANSKPKKSDSKVLTTPGRSSARIRGLSPTEEEDYETQENDIDGSEDVHDSDEERQPREDEEEAGAEDTPETVSKKITISKAKSKAKSKVLKVPAKKSGKGVRIAPAESGGAEGGNKKNVDLEEDANASPKKSLKLEGAYSRARTLAKAGKSYPSKIALGSRKPLRRLNLAEAKKSKRKANKVDDAEDVGQRDSKKRRREEDQKRGRGKKNEDGREEAAEDNMADYALDSAYGDVIDESQVLIDGSQLDETKMEGEESISTGSIHGGSSSSGPVSKSSKSTRSRSHQPSKSSKSSKSSKFSKSFKSSKSFSSKSSGNSKSAISGISHHSWTTHSPGAVGADGGPRETVVYETGTPEPYDDGPRETTIYEDGTPESYDEGPRETVIYEDGTPEPYDEGPRETVIYEDGTPESYGECPRETVIYQDGTPEPYDDGPRETVIYQDGTPEPYDGPRETAIYETGTPEPLDDGPRETVIYETGTPEPYDDGPRETVIYEAGTLEPHDERPEKVSDPKSKVKRRGRGRPPASGKVTVKAKQTAMAKAVPKKAGRVQKAQPTRVAGTAVLKKSVARLIAEAMSGPKLGKTSWPERSKTLRSGKRW